MTEVFIITDEQLKELKEEPLSDKEKKRLKKHGLYGLKLTGKLISGRGRVKSLEANGK